MKNFVVLLLFIVVGCGYTTRGFVYTENTIIIKPVINKIDITSESRKYSDYTSFPILIENRLTNEIISKFNIEGNLKVVSEDPNALKLVCTVNDYNRETLRYTEGSDEIEEQRLRLSVHMKLTSGEGKVLQDQVVLGETTYHLSGTIRTVSRCENGKWKIGSGDCIYDTEAAANAANSSLNPKSESAAQLDLIDDTARRICEAVTEEW